MPHLYIFLQKISGRTYFLNLGVSAPKQLWKKYARGGWDAGLRALLQQTGRNRDPSATADSHVSWDFSCLAFQPFFAYVFTRIEVKRPSNFISNHSLKQLRQNVRPLTTWRADTDLYCESSATVNSDLPAPATSLHRHPKNSFFGPRQIP